MLPRKVIKKLILSRANRLVFEENDHVLKAMMALI